MVRRSSQTERNRAPPGGELAILLTAEKRLADQLAAARTAAEELVTEARRRAESAAPAAVDDLGELDAAVAAETAGELGRIAGDLERRLARHAEAVGARLDELAEQTVALLLARIEVPP